MTGSESAREGLALDPAWEYYAPDPEVEEAVYGRRARGLDVLYDPESVYGSANWGFRLGQGNPNSGACFRLRRERRPRPADPEPKRCPKCARLFVPARKCRVFCSRACRGGAPKRLPPSAKCKACAVSFTPRWEGHEFCSRACASRATAPARRTDPPADFAGAYASGASMREMSRMFGVQKCQLQRWRRRLGLPARPTGRPAREGGGG